MILFFIIDIDRDMNSCNYCQDQTIFYHYSRCPRCQKEKNSHCHNKCKDICYCRGPPGPVGPVGPCILYPPSHDIIV